MNLRATIANWIDPERRSASNSLNNPAVPLDQALQSTYSGFGNALTVERLAGYPPVAQAVGMIAGDCAALPLSVYKRLGDGNREKDAAHESHSLINLDGAPNECDTVFDLWFDFFHDALLRGLGLLLIERDRSGLRPVALHRLDPDAWFPVKNKGRKFWVNYGSPPIVIPDADVIHHSGVRLDGLNPSSPIRRYAETFKVGTSLQKYASSFFENGAHNGGILRVPQGASKEAVANVEGSVQAKANPLNWFKTLVLRDGFEFLKTTASPKDAQVSELDETETRHVAQIYNCPPSRLGLKDSVAYNSLEQEEQRYFRSACGPHLIRVRSQCKRKLIRPSQQSTHFIDYLIDAMQWTDADARAAIATQGIQSGWLMRSEVRRWNNLPAVDGIDDRESEEGDEANQPNSDQSNEANDEDAGITASTTLNGAQITAAVDVIEKVQQRTLVEAAALELLVGVGLPRDVAQRMLVSQRTAVAPPTEPTPGDDNDQE